MQLIAYLSPLFSEGGEGREFILVTVAGLVGGAVQYLVAQALNVWRENKAGKAAQEKTIVDHLQALIARLEAEKRECGEETDRLQEEIRGLIELAAKRGMRANVLLIHTRSLERRLIDLGHSIDRYQDSPELVDERVSTQTQKAYESIPMSPNQG